MYDYYIEAINLPGRERVDPLLQTLQALGGDSLACLGQLLIVFLGVLAFLGCLEVKRPQALCAASIFTLSTLSLFGLDTVALRWHWFPLLAAFLYSSVKCNAPRGGRVVSLLKFVAVYALFLYTAGSLAPLGCVSLLFVFYFLKQESTQDAGGRSGTARFHSLLVLLGLVVACIAVPQFPLHAYPGEARLAPLSSLLLYGLPMIGPYFHPIPFLESGYLALLCAYFLRAAVLLLVLYATLRLGAKQQDEPARAGAFLLCGCLALFALFAELLPLVEARGALPFPVLTRLMPGLALTPLPWLLLPFLLFYAIVVWSKTLLRFQLFALVAIALLYVASWLSAYKSIDAAFAQVDRTASGSSALSLWGGSQYLLKVRGEWAKTPRVFESMKRLKLEEDYRASLSASPNAQDVAFALDADTSTRWRTARPQQEGDYFALDFEAVTQVARVVLSVQGVPSDFPRGIKVLATLEDGSVTEVFYEDDWLGPTKWGPQGLPYFGPQSEVILDFPTQQSVKGLRFVLLRKEEVFDWAITEVKLYRFP